MKTSPGQVHNDITLEGAFLNHMEGGQDAAITGSCIGNHMLNRNKVISGDNWFMMIGHPVLVSVARVFLGLMVQVVRRPGFPGQDISAMPFIGQDALDCGCAPGLVAALCGAS
ncbi:hypothetical protein SDC9_124340 [bioreactor metagenome]|uniref:Uncharacterized protein n=1 Tax=bioreactor metagenome TaxID=1076179 RepID=A0A645CK60_9ZZZZ